MSKISVDRILANATHRSQMAAKSAALDFLALTYSKQLAIAEKLGIVVEKSKDMTQKDWAMAFAIKVVEKRKTIELAQCIEEARG